MASGLAAMFDDRFDYTILGRASHRPWPMPRRSWMIRQTTQHLLFAHWPVDADVLRRAVPDAFELDLFEGIGWVGIVPFLSTNAALRGGPALPWLSRFGQLNVRTYVRVLGRPGVYFLSLDVGSRLTARLARAALHLPYHAARISVSAERGTVCCQSRRRAGAAAFTSVRYRATGDPFEAREGSLEHFLTERYCLYNLDRRGRPYRLEIHHPPWRLQPAEAAFESNTMAAAAGLTLPAVAPLTHFSRRQDMVAWAPCFLEHP